MTVDRTLSLMGLALAVAWVIGMGVWLYPDVREEFEEKQYLARMAQEHPPMIPTECIRARGVENRDFIREDKHLDRCWVDLPTFRRLYPELAPHTDEQASARIRAEDGLPLENWDGSPWNELLKGAALTFGPAHPVLGRAPGLAEGQKAPHRVNLPAGGRVRPM